MAERKNAVIIPALEPDRRLLDLIIDLQSMGFERIVVVDDGSPIGYEGIFSQARNLGVYLQRHDKNLGKGEAIKTGIRAAIRCWGNDISFITADADGQHRPEDIAKVDDAMGEDPGCLILGSRDFSGENVPAKSRMGNIITSFVYGLLTGKECHDTQTGLRGIPKELTVLALQEEGKRYEYEMNFLMDAGEKVPIIHVPIETVYEDNNSSSHFRPVIDSARIYGRFLRFVVSSVSGAAVDYFLFAILLVVISALFEPEKAVTVAVATVIARIASGIVNFVMNRHFAFRSNGKIAKEGVRYLTLFLGQMAVSAFLVSMISYLINPVVAKIMVDTTLFFISYIIQNRWVFKKDEGKDEDNEKTEDQRLGSGVYTGADALHNLHFAGRLRDTAGRG